MSETQLKSDLHTHSTVSDGALSPTELVEAAARAGVSLLALTDHDTLGGLDEAISAAGNFNLEVIPGVELSAEAGPNEVHILGYFVEPHDPTLSETLSGFARDRVTRIERIVERVQSLGLRIDMNHVSRLAGSGTIGRPHVARAMIELGYVNSVGEAFDRFLGTGRPAFVPRRPVAAVDLVQLLRRARAVPVLAHPLSTGDIEVTLRELVPAGLLGFETYYGEYSLETQTRLRAIADSHDLVPTGGSDFHGIGFKEGRDLGTVQIPRESIDRLRKAWESVQG